MPASHVTLHDLKIVHLGHSEDHSNEGFPVKPPFTMKEFTFTRLLSNLSDFDIFVWLFYRVSYCVSSIHVAFLIFAFFVFWRLWVFPHRAEYQSLCRSAPGGSPKQNLPGSQRVRPSFSKHALTHRWMAQFPGAEGQEPKKGEGSWWKGSYT